MSDIYQYLNKNLYATGAIKQNPDGTSSVSTNVATTSVGSTAESSSTEVKVENLVSGEVDGNLSFTGGFIQSKNFSTGSTGWRISANGDVEFSNGTFRGAVNATSGKFGTATNYWSVGHTGLTAVSASTDVIINYGKTDFGQDSTAGFIIGYDYSASKSKIEFGSGTTKLFKYDGTDLSLTGGVITGGTVRTSSGDDRIQMLGSSNTLEFFEDGIMTADMEPNATQGVGWTLKFYNDQGTDTDTGQIDYDYYVAGAYNERTISMICRRNDDGGSSGISFFSTTDDPSVVQMNLTSRLNTSIVNFDGFNSLGNSTNMFNDIWCDELHYNTLTAISDKRLKKNINNLTYGLAEVLAMRPVSFRWKSNDIKSYGFIAQEVNDVMPNIVKKVTEQHEEIIKTPEGRRKKIITHTDVMVPDDPTGIPQQQIDMNIMYPILVKAIQDLNQKVEDLQAQVNLLI